MTMMVSGCKSAIAAPTKVFVEYTTQTLKWNNVSGNRGYTVSIVGTTEEHESVDTTADVRRGESYDLTNLTAGDYTLKVKTKADGVYYTASNWSNEVIFTRNYESGVQMKLIKNDTEYQVVGIGKAYGDVQIESVYRGKPVTSIADSAFRNCARLTSIALNENITFIGERAFRGCSGLKTVDLSNCTKLTSIGKSAFQSCGELREIKIPDSITEIQDYTFNYCKKLTTIDFGHSVTKIGNTAFRGCEGLVDLTIPDSVTYIDESAFMECTNLKTLTLGANVETIATSAFIKNSSLETINFNENLKEIGDTAFATCPKLTEVALPDSLEKIGVHAFADDILLSDITLPANLKQIGRAAFGNTRAWALAAYAVNDVIEAGGDDLFYMQDSQGRYWLMGFLSPNGRFSEYTIKEGTIGIADYACRYLNSLQGSLRIPNSVKYIGNYSFSRMANLTTVAIGADDKAQIESIGEYAFVNCKQLQAVRFYSNTSLKSIGGYAFAYCDMLGSEGTLGINFSSRKIKKFPDSLESIGTYAFIGTGYYASDKLQVVVVNNWIVGNINEQNPLFGSISITSYVFPESTSDDAIVGIASFAFYGANKLRSISIPSSVKYINRSAFYKCESLQNVNLSMAKNIKKIEDYTFYYCQSLTNVTFPVDENSKIESIGRSAFYRTAMDEFTIPGTVKSIGDYCFYASPNLKKVTFNNGLESLGDRAFYKCPELMKVTFPASIKSIGAYCFYDCEKIASVSFAEGLETLGSHAFAYCYGIKTIELPNTLTVIPAYAFYKCNAVNSISFGNGITKINDYAFYNLSEVTNLKLPRSLTSIGKYAFKGMAKLENVILGSNITEMGAHAFYGATGATFFCEAGSIPGDWSSRWNSSYRPVIWGCTFDATDSYLISFAKTETSFTNVTSANPMTPPVRTGYVFKGWGATANPVEADLVALNDVKTMDASTVYAVWESLN